MVSQSRPWRCMVALTASAVSSVALAEGWNFEPEITLGGTYTDNFALAPEGAEQSDFVTELRPSFSLERSSPRFEVDIDYQYQHFFFAEESDRDQAYHNLSALTTSQVVPERLFVDLNGAYGQALIDPREPIPVSNVLVSDNLTDYWSADANPYYLQPLGSRHEVRLDYNYGVVRYPDFDLSAGNNLDSVDRQRYLARIGTNDEDDGWQYGVTGSRLEADYEDFDTFKSDNVTANIGIPLGRSLALVGRGGLESDVAVNAQDGGLDESFWEAGFRWRASARNDVEARIGHRFFGDTYYFQWQMDGSRFDAELLYQEAPTTLSIEQLNPRRTLVPNGSNPGFDLIALTNDVYINKEGTAQMSWGLSRNELVLTGRYVSREYVNDSSEDREAGTGLAWFLRLGPRTQINLGAYAGRVTFRNTDITDKLFQATLGATRLLGERTMLSLSLRHDQRRSNTVQQGNEYTERAMSLTVTRTFGRNTVAFGGRNNMPVLRN